jgi:hypothetical protein
MMRYALSVVAALLSFACGVFCALVFQKTFNLKFELIGSCIPPLVMLAAGAVCFGQAFPGQRGLRRKPAYNLLMLSMSGLLLAVGALTLCLVLVMAQWS